LLNIEEEVAFAEISAIALLMFEEVLLELGDVVALVRYLLVD
jgi:hypothetical protein